VGKAEKWRSPFLGEGWRCGVSVANTAKAKYLKNIFAPFFLLFLIFVIHLSLSNFTIVVCNALSFRFPIALRCPHIAHNSRQLRVGRGFTQFGAGYTHPNFHKTISGHTPRLTRNCPLAEVIP
jgi:hypothetical protein